MSTVVQPWVELLPWKMQSILFSSLRGPDQDYLTNIKQVSKWMRSVSQHNADPSKPYMNNIDLPANSALDKELEHCTVHFVHHFADGLVVIAVGHPQQETVNYAAELHYHIAEELFHFSPEYREVFFLRHRDKINGKDQRKEEWNLLTQKAYADYMASMLDRFDLT